MKKHLIIISIILVLLSVGFSGCTDTNKQGESTEIKDTDDDGYNDNVDAFPNDPFEWKDSDNDGVGDNSDIFPNNSNEQYDSDGDGVGDNADALPDDSTQWADRDGDGYGDNSNGFNPDAFPDDASEWEDTDSDGIGNNADIYDEGNGGIKVGIISFEGDGSPDINEDGGIIDPFFSISIEVRKIIDVIGDSYSSGFSQIYGNNSNLNYPFSYTVDVDDDIRIVWATIKAYDEDAWGLYGAPWDITDPIDLNGNSISGGSALGTGNHDDTFYPRVHSIETFSDDGRLDLQDEMDGIIEYYIKVTEIV